MHRIRRTLLALVVIAAAAPTAPALGSPEPAGGTATWPRWRGPHADGISTETSWVTRNLEKLRVAWQVKVGLGFSGVSVAGGRLYTMGYMSSKDSVICLDAATGKQIWSYSYPSTYGDPPGPRVTPTVDGQRVYALGQFGNLVCLDQARGSLVWSRSLTSDFGAGKPTWGFAGSPVVRGNLLLLNAGRSGMAVDKESGKLVWGSPGTGGYATVVEFSAQGRALLAVFGERALYGVDPESGAVAWSFPWVTPNDVNAADPLVVGESLFITSNYGTGCAMLAVKADGVSVVWKNTNVASHFSTPVLLRGAIFAYDGDANSYMGSFVCLDPATGEVRWREKQGVGSLLASGDRLFLLNEQGWLRLAEASLTGYREIAAGKLPTSVYWNMPVLADGRLYVRNMTGDLFCVDLRP